jgi:outer membrane protein assembly factor BamB
MSPRVWVFALVLASPTLVARADEPKYKVLGADMGRIALVTSRGEVEWRYPCRNSVHDLAKLPNGNYLFLSGPRTVVEVNPTTKMVVWSYTSQPRKGYTGGIEVHACQRLENGLTMIAETGNKRIIEVDALGKIINEVPLKVDHPHPHRDTRMVRKLASGNYLACHEGDGVVREYDPKGKVVWSYILDLNDRPRTEGHGGHGTEVFGALRKPDGNTLIAAGNGNRVVEVNPEGKIVWSIEQDELPGIKLAWVTTLSLRPNGNLIFGNCHAGPENPQLIEVTRDKKVVWTYKDFKNFGNDMACAIVLDE